MQLTNWLASWLFRGGKKSRRGRRRAASRWQRCRPIPALESLEPRTLPAVFTVTSLADNTIANDGQTTLREAIQAANNDSTADTIQFASALTASGPATIVLSGSALEIRTDMNIVGPGADRLTIDGNRTSRVFTVDDGANSLAKPVLISGVTIANGRSYQGAGIMNFENLTLDRVTVTDNATTNGYGGGIYNYSYGTLTILRSTIANNATTNGGGGGVINEGSMTIHQSAIRGNSASNGNGGGIFSSGTLASLTITQSTISENFSKDFGAGMYVESWSVSGALTNVVSQCTISANTSSNGGGGLLIAGYGTFTVSQSTIVWNSASVTTGGLLLSTYGSGSTTVTNTIIAGNTLSDGSVNDVYTNREMTSVFRNNIIGGPHHAGGTTNGVNGNIVGDGSGGVRSAGSVVNLNLTDNGGPTPTHAFVIGSPAINAGDNSSIPLDTADRDGDGNRTEADPFDQRGSGFARIVGGTVDIGANEQVGAILPMVTVAASPSSAAEEDGAGNLVFTLTRQTMSGPLTVNFGLSGTATLGTDYSASATNSVTFADRSFTVTVTVDPTPDSRGEMSETVILTPVSGTGYQIGLPKSATGTISNDDASVSIVATNASRSEPDSGTLPFTFTVTRTVSTSDVATVDYTITPSGISPANAADFGGSMPAGGTLTFATGETTKTITVNVSGDLIVEDNEAFTVTLSNAVNVGIGTAFANGLIKNNDSTVGIFGTLSERNEGNSGLTPLTFTVTREGAAGSAASVDYAVTGGTQSGNPVADAADFGGTLPSGTINFAPTETEKTLTIYVSGDTLGEPYENFAVTLSNPVGVQLLTPRTVAYGGIRNDDNSLSIAATSAVKAEGQSNATGTTFTYFTFTVTRIGTTSGTASAAYAVSGSGAYPANSGDFVYGTPSGTVAFAGGEVSKTITLPVTGESTFEPDEGFTVTLSNPVGATLATSSANGTILNDDSAFSIAALNASKPEGNSGSTPFTFTVNRSGNTQIAASVKYVATGSGTNRASTSDFGGVVPSGTVSFAVGETSKTITINVSGNRVAEPDEGFTVTLSNPVGGSVVTATANGTILNDDTIVSIAATDANKFEGDSGETPFTFTVTRTGDVNVASNVNYQVVGTGNRPATAADFGGTMPSGTLNFAAGEVSKVLELHVSGDTDIESNERFSVNLSNSVNAQLGVASANSVILSEELPPVLAISAVSAPQNERHAGSTSFEFTVTRTGDVSVASSADFAVTGSGSNPANANDFGGTLPTGTIHFAVGETTQTFFVAVSGDSQLEPNEGFSISLLNEVMADLGTAALGESGLHSLATGTILNDDVVFSISATSASKAEGSSGETVNTFTVTRAGDLRGASSVDFTVGWDSVPTAANAADFSSTVPNTNAVGTESQPTGTLTFAAGEATKIVTINVSGDTESESNEGFTVSLSNAVGGQIQTASADGTILDDDGSLSIAATSASKNEGHSGNTPFTFTVTRTGSASVTSSVDYTVSGNSVGTESQPTDAADFGGTLPSGQVTFAPGETSKTITINVRGDSAFETTEGFSITLSNPTGASVATASASGTILNDDAGLSIAALDAIKREGNSGNTAFTFTITRTGNTSSAVSANYVARGSGANPASTSDFGGTAPSGTVSFAANETSKVITINAVGNKAVEPDEGFTVTLSNASVGASLVTATADGTILNDDTALSIAATDANKLEGDPALGESGLQLTPFTFTVTRTGELSGASSATFRVVGVGNRPANAADFGGTLPSGTVSFAAGEASQVIVVNVSGDAEMESVESFTVSLSAPVGAVFLTSSATGVIHSEELPPVISIAATNSLQNEGHTGSTSFEFTVSRTGDVSVASSVDYRVTAAGTESQPTGDDFGGTLPTGTVNFAAGEMTQTIVVAVSGDTQFEADESFVVTLSNETTADLGTATASGTIANDDAVLSISPRGTFLAEGLSGNTAFPFLVTRTGDLRVATTVDFAVTGRGTDPANADDFNGMLPSGTLTFAAGESTKTITIDVSGDATAEAIEYFSVTLTNAGTDVIVKPSAPGMILDDDGIISIAATNASQVEGNSGYTVFTFTVTRTGSDSVESSVDVLATGSGTHAANGTDFGGTDVEMSSGFRLTFLPNESSKIIGLRVFGDTTIETDEGFAVTLSNPSNASIGTSAANGTIISDDAGLSIAGLDAIKREGNSGTTPFTFRVTRSGSTHGTASASYAIRGSGANPAASADFGGTLPRGTVSFADGESSKTITINVSGNKGVESDEDFVVTLSSPVNASLVTDSATGTILNDDTGLAVTANETSQLEGDSGETTFTFTVTRTGDVSGTTTANYAVAGNGAQPANAADFASTPARGSLSFAAGETSKTIIVNVRGELIIEPDETFAVTLSSPIGATLATASATSTILTDDIVPSLSISAVAASQDEAHSGTTSFDFTVTRTGNLTETSTADFSIPGISSDASADDFGGTMPSGSVQFAVGETAKTIVINVVGDTVIEPDEAFAVTLSNVIGATLSTSSATATIVNDDSGLSIAADSAVNAEGLAGYSASTFTVTRTGDIRSTTTVDFAVTGSGTNVADAADFNGTLESDTLTFAVGETSKTITVNVSGDTSGEPDEGFSVTLSNATGANLLITTASGTILDDDGWFSISADSGSHDEANSGNTSFTFTVTRTGSASVTSTVDFAVTGVVTGLPTESPANVTDFGGTLPNGSVTFAPGETNKTITIDVSGDTTVEQNEIFAVTLSNPSAAAIATASATGTILNDDASLSIAAASAVKTEGDSGNTPFTFTVTRAGSPRGTARANYAVRGSGTNPAATADFGGTLPSGIVNFADGESSKTITINVAGNRGVEPDEDFNVTLSNVVGVTLETSTAIGTIMNDDADFSIASNLSVVEGDTGTTLVTFTITRSGVLSRVASVQVRIFLSPQTGWATAADFVGDVSARMLNFAVGEISKTFVANIKGDADVETTEYFAVELFSAVGATLKISIADVYILNDDVA